MTTNIYIDESGSMCLNPKRKRDSNFIVAAVRVNNPDRCKRRLKRFISKNMEKLKESDAITHNKMFRDDKFIELKGTCMSKELEFELISYLCDENMIEIYMITVTNSKVIPRFYNNTARAFNYLLKLMILDSYKKRMFIGVDNIHLHLDNRNVRTDTVSALNEYLNTELVIGESLFREINVTYYQSECCALVQIADIIANIRYRAIYYDDYRNFLNDLLSKRIIKHNFIFPQY